MHEGHRNRLKAKLKTAPKSLEDHELLELLLFYSIPRRNTNDEAHRLLERFNSVKGVFDADLLSLQTVEGVGENSALLIKLTSELLSRYTLSEPKFEKTPLESPKALRWYLTSLFIGTNKELCYLILFDKKKKLMSTNLLSEGDSNGTGISMQKVAELVSDRRTAYVILAHNHPNGRPIPSGQDVAVTNILNNFLHPMQIQLIDHFIVAGEDCVPILNSKLAYMYAPNYQSNE